LRPANSAACVRAAAGTARTADLDLGEKIGERRVAGDRLLDVDGVAADAE
jgi:hypothetical protein